jgi:hypothetical protein
VKNENKRIRARLSEECKNEKKRRKKKKKVRARESASCKCAADMECANVRKNQLRAAVPAPDPATFGEQSLW